MIVSHAKRFIFIHNPKCAGTSFRDALNPLHDDAVTFWNVSYSSCFGYDLDYAHLRLWEIEAEFPDIFACLAHYRSVVFVRSPYARFLSAINEYLRNVPPSGALSEMTAEQRVILVENFVQDELTLERVRTDCRFVHFSPQIWFLRLGHRTVPRHVLPMDKRGDFTAKAYALLGVPDTPVPHLNVSTIDLTQTLRSPRVAAFVREFYAADFDFLRSRKELAGLAAVE